jgi:hypothetical protein
VHIINLGESLDKVRQMGKEGEKSAIDNKY